MRRKPRNYRMSSAIQPAHRKENSNFPPQVCNPNNDGRTNAATLRIPRKMGEIVRSSIDGTDNHAFGPIASGIFCRRNNSNKIYSRMGGFTNAIRWDNAFIMRCSEWNKRPTSIFGSTKTLLRRCQTPVVRISYPFISTTSPRSPLPRFCSRYS